MNTYVEKKFEEELERMVNCSTQQWVNGLIGASNHADKSILGDSYRGFNALELGIVRAMKGYDSNMWGTYCEISKRGGYMKAGEKSSTIFWFSKVAHTKIDENGDEKDDSYFVLKVYYVFNLAQTSLKYEPYKASEPLPNNPIGQAEKVVDGYADKPTIQFSDVDTAFYSPSEDEVVIPQIGKFITSESYYSTLFHELAHSTGAKQRLARSNMNGFGSDPYAKEELVAETTSAMLCGYCGIETEIENSASYIKSWLGHTQSRNKASVMISAFSQAEKAKCYMLGEKD